MTDERDIEFPVVPNADGPADCTDDVQALVSAAKAVAATEIRNGVNEDMFDYEPAMESFEVTRLELTVDELGVLRCGATVEVPDEGNRGGSE